MWYIDIAFVYLKWVSAMWCIGILLFLTDALCWRYLKQKKSLEHLSKQSMDDIRYWCMWDFLSLPKWSSIQVSKFKIFTVFNILLATEEVYILWNMFCEIKSIAFKIKILTYLPLCRSFGNILLNFVFRLKIRWNVWFKRFYLYHVLYSETLISHPSLIINSWNFYPPFYYHPPTHFIRDPTHPHTLLGIPE